MYNNSNTYTSVVQKMYRSTDNLRIYRSPLPNDNILDVTKLKQRADDI